MGSLEETLRRQLAARTPARAARQDLTAAAVLIPIVTSAADRHLLLTRRSASLRRQPGHISFPGGVMDAADPTPLAAALRESQEEIGLDSEDVDILGQLDERETVTGFRVTPFVGAVAGPYRFRPNHEVDELILVPLAALREPGVFRTELRRQGGRSFPVFHYDYKGYDIWGITGRIIKELLELVPGEP